MTSDGTARIPGWARGLCLGLCLGLASAVVLGCSDFEVRRALARVGYEPAQELVGVMYASGIGVERDFEQARRWLEKSAERGNRRSQFHLATFWAGEGETPIDAPAMLYWLERAADAGHAGAQGRLGELYLTGRVVERDAGRGMEWLRRAAAAGDVRAQTNLAFFELLPDSSGLAPTASARREAVALLQIAAERGFHPAQLNLATVYLEDGSPEADRVLGMAWLRRAATAGNGDAETLLGELAGESSGGPVQLSKP